MAALVHGWWYAYLRGDADTLRTLLADDFVALEESYQMGVSEKKSYTKESLIAAICEEISSTIVAVHSQTVSAQVTSDGTQVTSDFNIGMTLLNVDGTPKRATLMGQQQWTVRENQFVHCKVRAVLLV